MADQLVEVIREAILIGELSPGSPPRPVQALADELKVSRTPVREALLRLADAGMVRLESRGVIIQQPDVHELQEIFQLRLVLEPPAAYYAARRMDPDLVGTLTNELSGMKQALATEDPKRFQRFMIHDVQFHAAIIDIVGNRRLRRQVRELRDLTRTLGASALLEAATQSKDPTVIPSRSFDDVVLDHERVLTAIQDGNASGARDAMRRHIRQTGEMLLTRFEADAKQEDLHDPDWAEALGIDE